MQTIEQIEKELEEKFPEDKLCCDGDYCDGDCAEKKHEEIKQFYRSKIIELIEGVKIKGGWLEVNNLSNIEKCEVAMISETITLQEFKKNYPDKYKQYLLHKKATSAKNK